MKEIKIRETKNGYTVDVSGFIKSEGRYVYRSVDVLPMIEIVGELLAENKVEVKYK